MKKILLALGLILSIYGASGASEVVVFDSGKQFQYAKKCFDEKDYLAAIVEFKKFQELFPDSPNVIDAGLFIGMSWYNGGKFGNAVKAYEDVIETHGKERADSVNRAYFMLAQSHTASGNPVMGEIVLDNYIRLTDDTDEKDRARSRIGWMRFEAAKWEKAKKIFLEISDKNRAAYQVDLIIRQIEKAETLEFKNPKIAGSLALIPGAGYLYTERYQDALISFLLNGALIYAAYESFEREHYALGGVISFVGFGFYSGSIYGSVSSAHKYNKYLRGRFIEKAKKEIPAELKIGLIPDMTRKGVAVVLRYQF